MCLIKKNNMNCSDFENKMIYFYFREISDDDGFEYKKHIENCENCRRLFSGFSKSLELIEIEKETRMTENFTENVISEIKSIPIMRLKRIVSYSAVSALALLFFIAGLSGGSYLTEKAAVSENIGQSEIYYVNDLQQETAETVLLNSEKFIENE